MKKGRLAMTAGIAGACAVIGTAAGIATSSAQTTSSTSSTSATAGPGHGGMGFGAGMMGGSGQSVHSVSVVLDKAGTGFETVTQDSGTVVSVSGDTLVIKEAARGVTYQTATLSLPSSITVTRDGSSSSLSALQAGDTVRVTQSTDENSVIAEDSTYAASHTGGPSGARGSTPPSGRGAPSGMPSTTSTSSSS